MKLTAFQLDALRELVNIGVGRAAGVLNEMLQSHVQLHVPDVRVLSPKEIGGALDGVGTETLSSVQLGFRGPFSGMASLVFPTESAGNLVSLLLGDELAPTDLDSIRIGTLTEVGNIVLNGVMGSVGNLLDQRIDYAVPTYIESDIGSMLSPGATRFDAAIVLARTRFTIERLQVDGDILLLFEVGSFDALLSALGAV